MYQEIPIFFGLNVFEWTLVISLIVFITFFGSFIFKGIMKKVLEVSQLVIIWGLIVILVVGVPFDKALAMGIALHLTTLLMFMPIGVMALFHLGLRFKDLLKNVYRQNLQDSQT